MNAAILSVTPPQYPDVACFSRRFQITGSDDPDAILPLGRLCPLTVRAVGFGLGDRGDHRSPAFVARTIEGQ